MELVAALLLMAGVYPLAKALRANRFTTLRQALWWSLTAWLAWIVAAWTRVMGPEWGERLAAYGALCLSGCAGIAVLGARRPGAAAWNFVVVGLLAVLLLPILNGMGEPRLEHAQEIFLTVTLGVPVLNYLPTRLGPSAVLVVASWGWEMARLMGWIARERLPWLGLLLLALAPWVAWTALVRGRAAPTEFDRIWLANRDRFGFVWGQRMREQFNRAAHNAGWPVVLCWGGLKETDAASLPDPSALLEVLRAVLKRFEATDATEPRP